jgi:hypothetical protein
MLGARTFPGNPYDGHILRAVLEQAANLTQDLSVTIKRVVADREFRGKDVDADNPRVQIIHRGRYKSHQLRSGLQPALAPACDCPVGDRAGFFAAAPSGTVGSLAHECLVQFAAYTVGLAIAPPRPRGRRTSARRAHAVIRYTVRLEDFAGPTKWHGAWADLHKNRETTARVYDRNKVVKRSSI